MTNNILPKINSKQNIIKYLIKNGRGSFVCIKALLCEYIIKEYKISKDTNPIKKIYCANFPIIIIDLSPRLLSLLSHPLFFENSAGF